MKQCQKELSQVLVAGAVRRLTQEAVVAKAVGAHLELHRRRPQRSKKRNWSFLGYHQQLTDVLTAAPTLGKMSRHLLLQACALHKLRIHFGDVS